MAILMTADGECLQMIRPKNEMRFPGISNDLIGKLLLLMV